MQEFDHIPIEILNFPNRIYHAFVRARILTVGDLREFYINRDRYHVRNIGEKSLGEISKALEELLNNPSVLAFEKKESVQLSFHDAKWEGKASQSAIDILNLPTAIRGMLKSRGIKTVDDLRKTSDETLLRIRLIGPKKLGEIRKILADFDENPSISVAEKPVVIEEKKAITWAQIVEDYFQNEKDVYSFILISRFGYAPKTLEEIATELGVTRERVRQIQEAVAVRYLKHVRSSGWMGLLNKIERIFSTHGENLSLFSFRAILKKEGLLGQFSELIATEHIKNLDLLETMICWLNLITNKKYNLRPIEFSVDIFDLTKSGKISIRDYATLMNVSKREQRKIRRKVVFTGGITVKEASRILSKDEKIAILFLKTLNLLKIDDEWFTFKSLTDDQDNGKIPLRIAGLKMLAVTPTMHIDAFHDGLRRHASRFYSGIAPIHVIEHALPILGFEIKDNKVSTQLSTKGILSKSEQCLISAIRKNGGIASFLEIAEGFFLQNLSLPAVSATLKRSPIAEKVNEGFHKLRDTEISWQDIENAKKRQKRFAQDDEITHGLDGVIRMRFTVNSYAFLTGIVGAWSVKELSGSWEVLDEGIQLGDAKIDEAYLWGLAKIFKKLEVRMGERMELAFNTWNRTLSVRKVDNENS